MKADIPEEFEKMMDEKIYLDLELHILQKRLHNAENQNDISQINFYNHKINNTLVKLKTTKDFLRKNNIKISDPKYDDMFVQYNFYVKVSGGYKEGHLKYWKAALKLKLKRRLNNTNW